MIIKVYTFDIIKDKKCTFITRISKRGKARQGGGQRAMDEETLTGAARCTLRVVCDDVIGRMLQ